MSPTVLCAVVAVIAAFGAAGALAGQRDEPPPVRPTMAEAIMTARDAPVIRALALHGAPPALAKPAPARRSKRRHTVDASPAPDQAAPSPAPSAAPSAPRPQPDRGRPQQEAPRRDDPPAEQAEPPASVQPTPTPVVRAPEPEVGEEAEEGTGEEVAPE